MQRIAVILGDGHGIDTQGKHSPKFHSPTRVGDRVFEKGERFRENEFNAPVTDATGIGLQSCLIPVRQIAPEQKDISLSQRTIRQHRLYNELQALGFIPITLSIHANGFGDGETWNTAQGIETFFKGGCSDSLRLARLIQEETMKFRRNYQPYNHLTDRGVKTANFYVFRNYKGPVVLAESEFMTNRRTLSLLCSKLYRDDTVRANVRAIERFQGFSLIGDMRQKTEKTI